MRVVNWSPALLIFSATLLIGVAATGPLDLDPMVRPLITAVGGILMLVAMLQTLAMARRQQDAGAGRDRS